MQDPTKQEMLEYLSGIGADDFDAEVAIYAFAEAWHGGQSSNLYSALSTSDFRPGPLWRIENDEAHYYMTELESNYATA